MAVEPQRGCGYRKVGGLYLCGGGYPIICDRLPYELRECPVCGSGIKFSRGFQWLDWFEYAGEHEEYAGEHEKCECSSDCPVCHPSVYTPTSGNQRVYGLMWVGEAFYTPQSFAQEAAKMGISRRIAAVPKNLKLGKTWILLAHRSVIEPSDTGEQLEDLIAQGQAGMKNSKLPGIFYVFRPQRIELLIWESQATPEYLAELKKRNITSVAIPDGDVDHDPRTSLKPKAEEKDKIFFDNLRKKFERR